MTSLEAFFYALQGTEIRVDIPLDLEEHHA